LALPRGFSTMVGKGLALVKVQRFALDWRCFACGLLLKTLSIKGC
jgi:hypothetical protein